MSWRTVCLPWGVWCSRRVFAILRPAAWSAWASTRAVSLLAFMDSAMVRLETSSSISRIPPFHEKSTSGQSVQKSGGFGELPNKHFCGPCALQKFRSVATPELLAKTRNPQHGAKNGGYAFFYVSSVSFDAFIAWIVASTIFNSLSSKAFNMASIRFLHSLPLFWDG